MTDPRGTPKSTSDLAVDVGMAMARKIFEKLGNHSEIHLNEGELAGYLAIAHASAPSEIAPRTVKYMRYANLDRRIKNGDDFAGDAWVR